MVKSNVLLIGPTGSGKTYMVKILSKILDVPFIGVDATAFTEAGYAGDNVENYCTDYIKQLIMILNEQKKEWSI